MVVLDALAQGTDTDPRKLFAERLAEVEHLSVTFTDDDPPLVTLSLPDLVLQCTFELPENQAREHMALLVVNVRPGRSSGSAEKLLTVVARHPVVTATNGIVSDTYRLKDFRDAMAMAATSEQLYGALKLVDKLENAEKARAQSQRTHYRGVREFWRCRKCRGLWRPDDNDRCPSCGREFDEQDHQRPELGKVELTIPDDEPITLMTDAAVLVEPEDSPNFVGRVSRIDHRRRLVEVVCRTYEHAGSEGGVAPSFNRALYQAKRSVLAAIATRDFGVGLLAQLLVCPETISSPAPGEIGRPWDTPGMFSNPSQDRAVSLVANLGAAQCVFIQGPPGTGKTTVIVEAVKRRLANNPEERILVTSHSNLAVDNALERLAGTPGMRAVRVARAERVHSSVDQFRCDDEDDPRLLQANCYFATCATAATSAITDMNFDLVILDEANKARVDEALPALRLGAALALVGDHKQLPPVEDDSLYSIVEDDPQLEDLINHSLFEQAWEGGLPDSAKCLLKVQHRMHPQISSYVSAASYDGQLEDAQEVCAYDFVTRHPFPVALHFVDTEGMRGGRERRGPGGALRNEAEVKVAATVVRLLDERVSRDLSIAVIAMYAEQVERLRYSLGRRRFKRNIKIDTVDSFEGREEDIVVISLVRSNERGRIGFLRVPNRLNVAISRARRMVVCIGDSATLRSGEESMYGVLVEAARAAGGWMSASELVAPSGRPGRGRGGLAGATGKNQEGEHGEGAGQPRRRRRRRGGGQRPLPATPLIDGGATTKTETAAQGGAESDAVRKRRRRRRRGRRSPGVAVNPAQGSPATTATTTMPSLPGLEPNQDSLLVKGVEETKSLSALAQSVSMGARSAMAGVDTAGAGTNGASPSRSVPTDAAPVSAGGDGSRNGVLPFPGMEEPVVAPVRAHRITHSAGPPPED